MNKLQLANVNCDNHLEKWKVLQYVTDFDVNTLKDKGFDCSKRSIDTAKKVLAANNGVPCEKKEQKDVAHKISNDDIELINQHLYINSRPSPSEVLKNESKKRGRIIQKGYMLCSYKDSYTTFPYKDRVSWDTYYRRV